MLDELCRSFPVAQVVPDALVALGAVQESSRRLPEAAHTYKRLLNLAPDDSGRALAIWRMAHVYEERKLLVAARDSYLDLQARFPDIHLNGSRDQPTFADLVGVELARPTYSHLIADRPVPSTPVPLVRRWQWLAPSSQSIRVIYADGVAPSSDAGRLFVVDKTALRLVDQLTGAVLDFRARAAAPMGWVSSRQIDRSDPSSNCCPRAGPGIRAMALWPISQRK